MVCSFLNFRATMQATFIIVGVGCMVDVVIRKGDTMADVVKRLKISNSRSLRVYPAIVNNKRLRKDGALASRLKRGEVPHDVFRVMTSMDDIPMGQKIGNVVLDTNEIGFFVDVPASAIAELRPKYGSDRYYEDCAEKTEFCCTTSLALAALCNFVADTLDTALAKPLLQATATVFMVIALFAEALEVFYKCKVNSHQATAYHALSD